MSISPLSHILEIVMFENWLRFYFIEETKENDLLIRIPEQSFAQIEKLYPHLAPMADRLNNEIITHNSSMEAVCVHVATTLSGKTVSDTTIEEIFGSAAFQTEIQMFGTWVLAHETQLDEHFLPFHEWQEIFKEWRASAKVQTHADEINDTVAHAATTGSKEVH